MVEIGTVKSRLGKTGDILVSFAHLQTEAECRVLQSTTGANRSFVMPSVGTQVVCWLESGKNIALGAVFSDEEPVPSEADNDGGFAQFDKISFRLKNNKASLKNDEADFKTILKEILKTIKTLTVSTPVGPSGTPLPPTIQAATKCEELIDKLLQ